MGVVYGPYAKDDWDTMLMLRDNIVDMQSEPFRFRVALDKHKKLLKKFLTLEAA
jgi:hypothetical protein